MRALFLTSVILFAGLTATAWARDSLAEKYFMEGLWKRAIPEYRVLVKSEPTVENYNRLGLADFYGNNFREAQKSFERALNVHDNLESRIYLAMVKAVRDEDKLDELMAMRDEFGDSSVLLRSIGAALLHHKKHDMAMGYFQLATDYDPDDYMTLFYIGLVQERKHMYDDCMMSYRRSTELNPRFAQAVNNLGYCYKERHYYTYAIIQYEAAIAIEPDNANFHYNLGNAQTHKDMIPEALKSYKRATELDPEFAKAHYNLGRSYIGLDMLDEGMAELKLYLKYFDKSLVAIGAPPRKVVKEEIELLKDMIKEKEKGEEEGEEQG